MNVPFQKGSSFELPGEGRFPKNWYRSNHFMKSLRTKAPGELQRTGARNSLLGPSRAYQLLGQADSAVIEQFVLSLAPTHPPVKKSGSTWITPHREPETNQRGQSAPLLTEKERHMGRDKGIKKE